MMSTSQSQLLVTVLCSDLSFCPSINIGAENSMPDRMAVKITTNVT